MTKAWRVAGINFDHMHMGDNLRMAFEHPDAELVGIADRDPRRMDAAVRSFGVSADRVYTDEMRLLEEQRPDLVLVCPATADHAAWTERIAPAGAHILMEKPFAASVDEADRMIRAADQAGIVLAINWPLRWVASHVTAKRLVDENRIGEVREVHYVGGNRGPLHHGADKVESGPTAEAKADSWFYSAAAGGGSLLDYLGYGVTLGSWFNGGQVPLEVTTTTWSAADSEVDEHSVSVVRYAHGLSTFETRWGTFTDPWTHQPQPKCGFVLNGSEGTIASYDYEPSIRMQTRERPEGVEVPADPLEPPFQNPVQSMIHCLQTGTELSGPLSPAVSRLGQRIVDAAVASADQGRPVAVPE